MELSVVGFDGTADSVHALARAHQLGGTVHVVASLDLAAGGGLLPGVSVTQVTWERDLTPERVLDIARRVGAAVAVVLAGTVEQATLARAAAEQSVLVTTPVAGSALPPAYRGVLIDASGNEPSGAAAAAGARIAAACSSRLVIARAEDRRHGSLRRLLDEMIEAGQHVDPGVFRTPRVHDRALGQIRSRVAAHGAPAEYVHGFGPPAEVMAEVASAGDFDLWVTGCCGPRPPQERDVLVVHDGHDAGPSPLWPDRSAEDARGGPAHAWVQALASPVAADCLQFERCRRLITATDTTVGQIRAVVDTIGRAGELGASSRLTRRRDLLSRAGEISRSRELLAAWLAEPSCVGAIATTLDAAEVQVARARETMVGFLEEVAASGLARSAFRPAAERLVEAAATGATVGTAATCGGGLPRLPSRPLPVRAEIEGLASSAPSDPDNWFLALAHLQRATLAAERIADPEERQGAVGAALAAHARLLEVPRLMLETELVRAGASLHRGFACGRDTGGDSLTAAAVAQLQRVSGLAELSAAIRFADDVLAGLAPRLQLVG